MECHGEWRWWFCGEKGVPRVTTMMLKADIPQIEVVGLEKELEKE